MPNNRFCTTTITTRFAVASVWWVLVLFPVLFLSLAPAIACAKSPPVETVISKKSASEMRQVIVAAFKKTHDGWSSDEVILNTTLNDLFIAECQRAIPKSDPAVLNWTLLNLRKAGQLKIATTRRSKKPAQDVSQIAEIAARLVHDRHQVSTDRMMADPQLRAEFDREVQAIDGTLKLYDVRKAAFQLRKQRRLRPELIARIADWGREIKSFSLASVREKPKLVPAHPGIYIFRDASGYLYIGQSNNLRKRLKAHLEASSNFSLSQYLVDRGNKKITIEVHAFAPDSRAKETMIRRAYESELIASRKPRFNIQP